MAGRGRLLSVEIDGNCFAVEFEIDDHGIHRVELPVDGDLSARVQRVVIQEVLPALMTLPGDELEIDLVESHESG
jgi:hypothetical protein